MEKINPDITLTAADTTYEQIGHGTLFEQSRKLVFDESILLYNGFSLEETLGAMNSMATHYAFGKPTVETFRWITGGDYVVGHENIRILPVFFYK